MSSAQTRRGAPSAGTKVNLGKDAPVTREAAGRVPDDSLAAESYRAGGEFAKNRDAEPGKAPAGVDPYLDERNSNAEPAPSYVSSQYVKYKGGPRGKNLKEGGFDHQKVQDGIQKAFNSEPGSIDDPGRLAEVTFEQYDAATPRMAGTRDVGLKTGTAYDGLDRDVDA
ncbi:uncharacterized protein MAM_04827 [Metarhizium album ARSEF 1941]|uniref:Uncharacterized protein n=1 Tax=Metarhizium album (strain ARSEF 1941) TaxID=1081103 RepID=A0A0B2WWI4_METAS|nr:uncharacterized protein MAM_04827 [Metarhizium album ARSEF 1941]KHN97230.1 hypothetical protein MAM_04827 [Metarhizium album ARSEF 1941]